MEKKRDLIKIASSLCYHAHVHTHTHTLTHTHTHTHTHTYNSKSSLYVFILFFFFFSVNVLSTYLQPIPPPFSHTHKNTHTNTDTLLHCTLTHTQRHKHWHTAAFYSLSLSHTHTQQDITTLTCTLSQTHTQEKSKTLQCTLSLCAWERTQRWVRQVNVQPLQTRTNDAKNKWCHQAPDSSLQLSSGNLSPVNSLSELLPLTDRFPLHSSLRSHKQRCSFKGNLEGRRKWAWQYRKCVDSSISRLMSLYLLSTLQCPGIWQVQQADGCSTHNYAAGVHFCFQGAASLVCCSPVMSSERLAPATTKHFHHTCWLWSCCPRHRLAHTIIGGSCLKYNFRHDKHVFVATKHVSCRDKSMLVTTKLLSWQNIFCHDKKYACCDKHDKYFVATKVLSQQAYFCRDKRCPLSQQTRICCTLVCHDKTFVDQHTQTGRHKTTALSTMFKHLSDADL